MHLLNLPLTTQTAMPVSASRAAPRTHAAARASLPVDLQKDRLLSAEGETCASRYLFSAAFRLFHAAMSATLSAFFWAAVLGFRLPCRAAAELPDSAASAF